MRSTAIASPPGPPPRHREDALRTPARALGVAVLLIGAVVAVLLLRDARAVQAGLQSAEAQLRTAEVAVGDEDFERAAALLQSAGADAEAVLGRLDGPGWALVSVLPRVGDAPLLAEAAADLVIGTATIGEEGLSLAAEVLSPGALADLVDGGNVDVDRLRALSARADRIELEPLRVAQAELGATRVERLPASLLDDRQLALDRADELLDTLSSAQAGLDTVIEFVGGEGPRRYLVVAQNPAELRGTGGLIGFLAELTFVDGEASYDDGTSFDAEEDLAQRTQLESTRDLPPPVERPEDFADRYDHVGGGQYFGSVNLDPDLPTVGPVLSRLYEQQLGRPVDGVLAVDPFALGGIVAATGEPLDLGALLPADLAGDLPAGLPTTIPGAAIPRLVMVDGYDLFGGGGPEKKALDRAVIEASLARFFSGDWEPGRMVATLRQLLAQRHVQVFSATASTQASLEAAGIAGAMPDGEDTDVLAVTASNAAPNKADVHVEHRISGRLDLTGSPETRQLRRTGEVRVTVTNPLRPSDHVQYITGSYAEPVGFGSGQPEYVDEALVRTYLNMWVPASAQLWSVRDTASGIALRTDMIHGLHVFDAFLPTPSLTSTAIEVPYEGPVPAERRPEGWVYELVLWRQAKGIPDHYDLRFTLPPGYLAVEAGVTGGDAVPGLSDVPLEQLTAMVDDGGITVRGHASQDARVRIVFERAGG